MIYELAAKHYEAYKAILFDGPEGEAWESICDSVFDEAARNCLANGGCSPNQTREYGTYIGLEDLLEHMVSLIEAKGFVRVIPVVKSYWGGGILDTEDEAFPFTSETRFAVREHNHKITAQSRQH